MTSARAGYVNPMGTGILFLIVGSIAIVAPEIFLIPLGELLALDARTTVQLSGLVFCFCAVSRAVLWILRRRIAGTACSRSGMVALGTAGPGMAAVADRGDLETMPIRARHEAAHAVVALAFGMTVHRVDILMRGNSGGQVHWSAPDSILRAPVDQMWARIVIGLAGMVVEHGDGIHDSGPDDDIRNAMLCAMKIICIGRRPQSYPTGELTVEGILTAASKEAERVLDRNAGIVERIQARLLEPDSLGLRGADLVEFDVGRV
ncbi:hypothetical protein L687_05070 [Microbacterium maritypicum MF109]|uniref:Peptidase M41 domain-containing protein n=1 Tax=Microbacterium maritypicum MF109 TaxID=1333857 RepID=T5KEB7_MICMQ|nr:hypothetical protein L687_05070 [Microbacterium maritypicum MF109]